MANWSSSGTAATAIPRVYEAPVAPFPSGYGPRVDITARFVDLVTQPDADIPLDEAALLIAAHDHPVDVAEQLRMLDDLAAEIDVRDAASLAHNLFVTRGFAGNTVDYTDPQNSYLDLVISRRLGLPITLSVLMIEIGRRLGIPLAGVGMPGHFLVGTDGAFVDPFHRGAVLDRTDAQTLFERTHPGAPFVDAYLEAVSTPMLLARMLANLVHSFATRAPMAAVWALRLRLAIPELAEQERRDGERLLQRLQARAN